MKQIDISSLLDENIELCSFPDIYAQFEQMLNDTRFSVEDIGEVIAKDPGLTAGLLKVVNSSLFGFDSRIDTVPRAINLIGLEDLQHLALAVSATDTFEPIPDDLADMTDFWMRSVNCAIFCRLIASTKEVLFVERMYFVGLLHDIGSLVLYQKLPSQCEKVLIESNFDRRCIAEIEYKLFGFTHADVSGEVLRSWSLPDTVVEPITHYLKAESSPENVNVEASMLFLATFLSDRQTLGFTADQINQELPANLLAGLELEKSQVANILQQAPEEFNRIFDLISSGKKFH